MITTSGVFRFKMRFAGLKSPKPNNLYDHFASLVSHFVLSVWLYVFTVACTGNLSMSISAPSPEMKNLCKVPDYCEFRLSGNRTTNSKHCIMYQNVSIILLKNLYSLLTLLLAGWWHREILSKKEIISNGKKFNPIIIHFHFARYFFCVFKIVWRY